MAISVNKLTKSYGDQKAVDDLSFTSEGKEIIGFLGPNGAGKSTTMKMLTAYLPPTSGSAAICGYDIITQPMEVKNSIGYLPESNPLYYDMYVMEFLGFIAGVHRLSNKRNKIEEVIEKVGLEKEAKKKIGSLSKGYKQRVGIAQAIIHDPQVLILDEPTSGLDANQLQEIRTLIKELGKEKTIIFSSHIMQEIEALCDRVIIIDKGKMVADDNINALKRLIKGQGEVKVEFQNKPNNIQYYQNINGVSKVTASPNNQLIIRWQGEHDIRADVFATAVKQDDVIIEMTKLGSSMEQIFQKLTEVK